MAEKDWLRAGIAQECITPEPGCFLGGYPYERVAQSVMSDLFAKAVVFENNGVRLAVVVLDLITVTKDVVGSAKERLAATCGISPDAVMISATHTHTGPEIRYRKHLTYDADPAYNARLVGAIVAAVERACASMFDAWLYVGATEADGYSHNRLRRLVTGQDSTTYHMPGRGAGTTGIVGVAGPLDSSLYSLCLRDATKRVRGMLVNFAAHPNKRGPGDNEVWAEWPGETARTIAAVYGDDVPCLFLQGTAGDVDCVPGLNREWVGRGIAGAAIMATERVAIPMKALNLAGNLDTLAIPYCTRTPELGEVAERLRHQAGDRQKAAAACYDLWDKDNQTADVPVQCFRVGDIAFVGLPGEVFTALGLEIKRYSPAACTFVVAYANEVFGYIPPADQAWRGGYGETPIQTRHLSDQAGGLIVDAAVRALHDMWT